MKIQDSKGQSIANVPNLVCLNNKIIRVKQQEKGGKNVGMGPIFNYMCRNETFGFSRKSGIINKQA